MAGEEAGEAAAEDSVAVALVASAVVEDSRAAAQAAIGDAHMAKMTLEELVAQLRAAYGAELRTVVLYGSAAAGEHIANRSDYNVLVIVDSLALERLRAAAAVAHAWGEAGNPAPLTLTTSEWRGSADIFPMEYADILERHKVLYGTPPFDDVHVEKRDLRLQLELETMSKLLRLRQAILASGGDEKRQVELLERSLSAIMIVFRAVMRLHGEVPSTDNRELVKRVAQLAGIEGAAFDRVVRHVRREQTLAPADAGSVLSGYLEGMQRLVSHLDAFAVTDGR